MLFLLYVLVCEHLNANTQFHSELPSTHQLFCINATSYMKAVQLPAGGLFVQLLMEKGKCYIQEHL